MNYELNELYELSLRRWLCSPFGQMTFRRKCNPAAMNRRICNPSLQAPLNNSYNSCNL